MAEYWIRLIYSASMMTRFKLALLLPIGRLRAINIGVRRRPAASTLGESFCSHGRTTNRQISLQWTEKPGSGKYSRSLARERVVFDDALHDPKLWLSTLSTLRLDYLTSS